MQQCNSKLFCKWFICKGEPLRSNIVGRRSGYKGMRAAMNALEFLCKIGMVSSANTDIYPENELIDHKKQ